MWLDYDDKYAVSEDGDIKHKKSGRITKGTKRKLYNIVSIYSNSTYKAIYVHRMVAHCFCPKIDAPNLRVDHINQDKRDNRASNLRWVSQRINALNNSTTGDSGEKNIYTTAYGTYRVALSYCDYSYQKCFKTLAEAIVARDSQLK